MFWLSANTITHFSEKCKSLFNLPFVLGGFPGSRNGSPNRFSSGAEEGEIHGYGVIEPMVNVKPVQLGRTERMSFSRINEVLGMPNLIEIQKNSYAWFLNEGLKEVFNDVSGITDFTGNLVLDFVDYKLDDKPNYSVEECKERDATYAAALRVKARLHNRETGEVKESEVFMGDFPLMTDSGTFVINGA